MIRDSLGPTPPPSSRLEPAPARTSDGERPMDFGDHIAQAQRAAERQAEQRRQATRSQAGHTSGRAENEQIRNERTQNQRTQDSRTQADQMRADQMRADRSQAERSQTQRAQARRADAASAQRGLQQERDERAGTQARTEAHSADPMSRSASPVDAEAGERDSTRTRDQNTNDAVTAQASDTPKSTEAPRDRAGTAMQGITTGTALASALPATLAGSSIDASGESPVDESGAARAHLDAHDPRRGASAAAGRPATDGSASDNDAKGAQSGGGESGDPNATIALENRSTPSGFAGHLAQAGGGATPGLAGLPGMAGTSPSPPAPNAAGQPTGVPMPVHVGSIATPPGEPAFAGRLAGDTLMLALSGVERAEISLQPRDLGPIRIELSLTGDSASIAFAATQAETRHAIERSLPLLQDMLAERGLVLSDASVSDQPPGNGQAGRDAGSSAHSGSGRAGQAGSTLTGIEPIEGASASTGDRRTVLRGLVDLYV